MALGPIELLRARPRFLRLWIGQCVSELGDWFQLIAVVSIFPTAGKGAAALAGVFLTRYLTAALVTPFAGWLADRFHRGRVMIGADLARAVVALCFLLVRGPEDWPLLYGLSLLLEAGAIVFEPSRGAAIPELVGERGLFAANTLGAATWSGMLAVGAFVGGVVTHRFGRDAAFLLDALSFVVSAAMIHAARVGPTERSGDGEGALSFFVQLSAGVRYLRAHRPQAAVLFVKAGALLAGGMSVLASVFADRVLVGASVELTTGYLYAARGFGALVGPFVAARFVGTSTRGLRRAILAIFPLSLAAFLAFAHAPTTALACAALVVAHGGTSTAWVASAQLLQLTVPNRLLGRVLSLELMLLTLALVLSNAVASLTLASLDLPPRLAATCVALMLVVPAIAWVVLNARFGDALDRAARTGGSEGELAP